MDPINGYGERGHSRVCVVCHHSFYFHHHLFATRALTMNLLPKCPPVICCGAGRNHAILVLSNRTTSHYTTVNSRIRMYRWSLPFFVVFFHSHCRHVFVVVVSNVLVTCQTSSVLHSFSVMWVFKIVLYIDCIVVTTLMMQNFFSIILSDH